MESMTLLLQGLGSDNTLNPEPKTLNPCSENPSGAIKMGAGQVVNACNWLLQAMENFPA